MTAVELFKVALSFISISQLLHEIIYQLLCNINEPVNNYIVSLKNYHLFLLCSAFVCNILTKVL